MFIKLLLVLEARVLPCPYSHFPWTLRERLPAPFALPWIFYHSWRLLSVTVGFWRDWTGKGCGAQGPSRTTEAVCPLPTCEAFTWQWHGSSYFCWLFLVSGTEASSGPSNALGMTDMMGAWQGVSLGIWAVTGSWCFWGWQAGEAKASLLPLQTSLSIFLARPFSVCSLIERCTKLSDLITASSSQKPTDGCFFSLMYKCEIKSKESPHNWVCGEGATWRLASAEGLKIRSL